MQADLRNIKTLAQFQWFFRDTARYACTQHSPAGGIAAVDRVLQELGLLDMAVGPGVSIRNIYDLQALPVGTVLTQSEVESSAYGVQAITRHGGNITNLLGRGPDYRLLYTIDTMPGVEQRPAWLDIEPTPHEGTLISGWKKVAWKAGWEAKERHAWCGDFERVMYGMEIHS